MRQLESRWFTAETLLESPSETPSTSSSSVQQQSQKSPSQGSDVKKEKKEHYRQPLGSHLKLYGRDLTADAEHGLLDPLIGRQDVVERTLQILLRRTKNNPVLIGDPGVGKTAVVEGIAQLMVTPESPRALQGCSLVVLDIGTLVGGTQYRGAFEERIQGILNDVRNSSGRIILFVDEIHMLMDTGRTEGGLNAANLLKPALARGELHCIGATTIDEYRKYIEPDAAFSRRLQPVFVDEPSPQDTLLWLQGLRSKYEAHHGVEFSDEAIATAVTAAGRFISDRKLPDSAIDLLDEAASRKQLALGAMGNPSIGLGSRDEHVLSKSTMNKKHRDNEIPCPHCGTPLEPLNKDVLTISCTNCGHTVLNIPPEKLMLGSSLFLSKKPESLQSESDKFDRKINAEKNTKVAPPQIPIVQKEDILHVAATASGLGVDKVMTVLSGGQALSQLGHDLSEEILGQSKSLTEMMNTLRVGTALASSGKRKKPLATFLLQGPTGTGKKTSLKTIAESLFGSDKSFLSLDMSQYVDRTASSRLIGAAPGFIGYGDGGLLTEFVKRHPHSVIVMDNIEKSHPEIISLLRQICQDGFIIDGMGRKIDFRNTVLGLITAQKSEPRKMDSNNVSTSKDQPKRGENIASSGDTMDVSTPNHAALELTIDKSGQSGSSSMSLSTVLRDTLQDCLDATIDFVSLSPDTIESIAMREVESCREIFDSSGVSLVIDNTVYEAIFGNQQQVSSPVNGHQARSIARAKILDPAFSELNTYLASPEPQTAHARKRIVVRPHGLSCVALLE